MALLILKEPFSKEHIKGCVNWECTLAKDSNGKEFLSFLDVDGSFAYSPSPLQEKHYDSDPSLAERPLSCWAFCLPEVGGGPCGHGVKLLPQEPHLPQQRQCVHAHQDRNPELPAQQPEPPWRAAATWRHLFEQVGYRRGNEKKVGNHHGQDEEEEEAVIALADAAVEEKAVVVVVLDAQVTEFAVFSAVRKKQLWGKENKLWSHMCK